MLRRWWPVPAVCAVAAVVTPREPFSAHARVVTGAVIAAVLALALAWGRHRRAEPPPAGPTPRGRAVGYGVWLLFFALFLVHQMSMFHEWPREVYPTMSSLWNIGLQPYPARAAAFAAWIGFGVFVVRRVPLGPDADGPPSWRAHAEVTPAAVVRERLRGRGERPDGRPASTREGEAGR